MKKIAPTVALILLSAQVMAGPRQPAPLLEYRPDDEAAPMFVLSAATATNSDPVVISATDRSLKSSDRAWRTELQRYWLGVNVPEHYLLVDRSQVTCPARKKGEFGRCDEYIFTDPAGQEHSFHFYLSNWP